MITPDVPPNIPPAVMLAAPRSGSGKTTLTLSLIAALRARDVPVRAAKCGPDYIDSAFHARASGAACFNLDGWSMNDAQLDHAFLKAGTGAEMLVIEAAMGLFDGVTGAVGRTGSAAEIAKRYRVPVVLVVDTSGQAQSVGALVDGFRRYDPGINLAGVILNRVASPRHEAMLREGLAPLGIPVIGAFPRSSEVMLEGRHLGLVQVQERSAFDAELAQLAKLGAAHLDLTSLLDIACATSPSSLSPTNFLKPPGQRIALAQDAAFTFMYDHLVDAWREAGAELLPFSPLANEAPAPHADCCWLPGGYPELHAAHLSAADTFRAGVQRFAETKPVHGECGGFMVLGESLEDAEGQTHEMLGLLRHRTSFAKRRLHLGYRALRLVGACVLGNPGQEVRGHEFHYATVTESGAEEPLGILSDGTGAILGPAGGRRGAVSGTFFHAIAVSD